MNGISASLMLLFFFNAPNGLQTMPQDNVSNGRHPIDCVYVSFSTNEQQAGVKYGERCQTNSYDDHWANIEPSLIRLEGGEWLIQSDNHTSIYF